MRLKSKTPCAAPEPLIARVQVITEPEPRLVPAESLRYVYGVSDDYIYEGTVALMREGKLGNLLIHVVAFEDTFTVLRYEVL